MALWFWNAIKFMESQLFFPVVQRDTRHETGISERKLYAQIAITGERTILPITAALVAHRKF